MNTIKRIGIGMAILYGCSGCASMLYPSSSQLQKLQSGMTKEEVTQLFGEPVNRRFHAEYEEWEYKKYYAETAPKITVVLVGFESGKVVSLDSFQPVDAERPLPPTSPVIQVSATPAQPVTLSKCMSEEEFAQFRDNVRRKLFKEEQLEWMRLGVRGKLFTCRQCVSMMDIFHFDDERMEVVRIFAPHLVDLENGDQILKKFPFRTEEVRKLLLK